jgi:GT2 family glycosyltransferase
MNLFELPFDQYQRYRMVADLLLAASGGPPERVLEVGGGVESRLADFVPEARVVVADVVEAAPARNVTYLRADGCTPLPFRDGAFPAAVTVDTVEHLPRERRAALLRELRRVATGPIVIACPVATPEAVAAELAVGACYRAVFAREHRWLAEHRIHGLPEARDVEAALDDLGGAWVGHDNGYLPEWQTLMLLHLVFDDMPAGSPAVAALRALDAIYNERLYASANRPPAYRMVWLHVPPGTTLPTPPPSVTATAQVEDRQAFEAALAAAGALVPIDREGLLAEVEVLQRQLAGVVHDRLLVVEDRDRVERLRHETAVEREALRAERDVVRAERDAWRHEGEALRRSRDHLEGEIGRVNADRERLEIERNAWISECQYLQRRSDAFTRENRHLSAEHETLLSQVGELRWRLGRLWPLDRVADVVAPVVGPVIAPARRRRTVVAEPPAPYGPEAQSRLTGIVNGAGPASAPLTVLLLVPEATPSDAIERSRRSLAAQTAAPAMVRELSVPMERLPADFPGTHAAFVLAGDRLAPNACAEIASALARRPDATIVYSDEDEWPEGGPRRHPRLKPGWDPELARAAGYVGWVSCSRRDLVAALPAGLAAADILYSLALSAAEHDEALAVHVPLVLCHGDPANRDHRSIDPTAASTQALLTAHLRRCGDPGEALPAGPGLRIRRALDPGTLVSIIIPYRDGPDLTERCVASLLAHTRHPSWEIVFVDNGSTDPRAEALVQDLVRSHPGRVEVLRYPLPYNFSAMNNLAARRARGEVVVLLNNDTEIQSEGWLEQLAALAMRPTVGAVGALLFFPDGTIQHCGIVLGMGSWPGRSHGVAGLVLRGCRPEDVDPLLYAYDRRAGAVTAACVAVRRDRYLEVGGLDETLRNDFNDVDLCLKLEAHGHRTLYTPHVRVTHHESVTRSYRTLDAHEVELMFERWADRLAVDPHVSPHLDRTTLHPPLAMRPVTSPA